MAKYKRTDFQTQYMKNPKQNTSHIDEKHCYKKFRKMLSTINTTAPKTS